MIFTIKKNRSILHRSPNSGLVRAYIGSDGTDVTASRLSMVEETGVPGENPCQQWVKTKTPQPWLGIEPRPAGWQSKTLTTGLHCNPR